MVIFYHILSVHNCRTFIFLPTRRLSNVFINRKVGWGTGLVADNSTSTTFMSIRWFDFSKEDLVFFYPFSTTVTSFSTSVARDTRISAHASIRMTVYNCLQCSARLIKLTLCVSYLRVLTQRDKTLVVSPKVEGFLLEICLPLSRW